jgi:D-alanyl-lipoteichoic acid acyltransferase DltB (MBOAT superfamily)
MSFTTPAFLVLFAVTCVLYFNLGRTWQNVVILIAGLVFYGWWDWRFLFLIFATTAADYFCAILIYESTSEKRRRFFFGAALLINLTTLGLFKYLDFFIQSASDLIRRLGGSPNVALLHLVLPLGISFYTFHALSYAIDVYRHRTEPERSYLIYVSYVMFFPLLVAGPIERAWHLMPQFRVDRTITAAKIWSGVMLCASGFVKKIVIADNVAVLANYGFGRTSGTGAMSLLAIYAFAIQIYCDFSAYSDIARGSARILGFEVFQNFELPYLTTNPRQFWRAWHISLSSWFRDYLYIPLGGNRGSRWQTLRNLAITMLLCGLWHGAAWVFILWGAFHGAMFAVYDVWSRSSIGQWVSARKGAVAHTVKCLIFFQFVCLGWLLFRADSVDQAKNMLRSIVFNFSPDATATTLAVRLGLFAVPLLLVQIWQYRFGMAPWDEWRKEFQVVALVAAALSIILVGAPDRTQFIYFQF